MLSVRATPRPGCRGAPYLPQPPTQSTRPPYEGLAKFPAVPGPLPLQRPLDLTETGNIPNSGSSGCSKADPPLLRLIPSPVTPADSRSGRVCSSRGEMSVYPSFRSPLNAVRVILWPPPPGPGEMGRAGATTASAETHRASLRHSLARAGEMGSARRASVHTHIYCCPASGDPQI